MFIQINDCFHPLRIVVFVRRTFQVAVVDMFCIFRYEWDKLDVGLGLQ